MELGRVVGRVHVAASDAGAVLRVQPKMRSDRYITDLIQTDRIVSLIGMLRQPIWPDHVIDKEEAHVEENDFLGWRVHTGGLPGQQQHLDLAFAQLLPEQSTAYEGRLKADLRHTSSRATLTAAQPRPSLLTDQRRHLSSPECEMSVVWCRAFNMMGSESAFSSSLAVIPAVFGQVSSYLMPCE